MSEAVEKLYSTVRAKYENAALQRQRWMIQAMNGVSAGLGESFIKDKVSFEGKIKNEEGILRKILTLFEEIAETEEAVQETPLVTEVEPEKPDSS